MREGGKENVIMEGREKRKRRREQCNEIKGDKNEIMAGKGAINRH